MALKTIEEHNAEREKREKIPELCGIACPVCGKELVASPERLLDTRLEGSRYMKFVSCPECDFSDLVLA
jgi:predicted RNA-binding Zn-ribbon protein involved in translation (DUF1610 family)